MKAPPAKSRHAEPSRGDARRLLAALAAAGAYGFEEAVDSVARIAVAAARNGVSVRVATFAPAFAARLCADDLARWSKLLSGGRRRLELTAAGRARHARDTAADGADPFLAQHKPLMRGPADSTPAAPDVLHDQAESPLVWLAMRKGRNGRALIDAAMLEAGERLRRDLTLAQILPRVTANWSAVAGRARGAGAQSISDVTLAARQRTHQALDAVGPDFAGLLIDIAGFGKGLERIESERGWPLRSAKVVLVLALNQLCRHYGIGSAAVGARGKGLLHWGADGFRPTLRGER